MYKNSEELQKKINEYFESLLRPVVVWNKQQKVNEVLYDNKGNMIYEQYRPATTTGMALFLGFSGRQALINYQEREEFVDAITRAKARIEQYAEERLYDKDGCNGAKFTLANNFGWKEKQEIEQHTTVTIEDILDDI